MPALLLFSLQNRVVRKVTQISLSIANFSLRSVMSCFKELSASWQQWLTIAAGNTALKKHLLPTVQPVHNITFHNTKNHQKIMTLD
jgi:hypothetical protein